MEDFRNDVRKSAVHGAYSKVPQNILNNLEETSYRYLRVEANRVGGTTWRPSSDLVRHVSTYVCMETKA
jgi:hypothetical protein